MMHVIYLCQWDWFYFSYISPEPIRYGDAVRSSHRKTAVVGKFQVYERGIKYARLLVKIFIWNAIDDNIFGNVYSYEGVVILLILTKLALLDAIQKRFIRLIDDTLTIPNIGHPCHTASFWSTSHSFIGIFMVSTNKSSPTPTRKTSSIYSQASQISNNQNWSYLCTKGVQTVKLLLYVFPEIPNLQISRIN